MLKWILATIVFTAFSWDCGVNHDWESQEEQQTNHGRVLQSALARGTTLQPIRIRFEYQYGLTDEQRALVFNEILPATNL